MEDGFGRPSIYLIHSIFDAELRTHQANNIAPMQAADSWLLFMGISVYKAALPQNQDLLDG
jgi:hypothetical protein